MKNTINFSQFSDRFARSDTYKDNFSYEWLKALYNFLIEYEEQTNQETEFDIVALCCDFIEYDSIKDAFLAYKSEEDFNELCEQNKTDDPEIVEQVRNDSALEYLQENTTVIEIPSGGVIIQNF